MDKHRSRNKYKPIKLTALKEAERDWGSNFWACYISCYRSQQSPPSRGDVTLEMKYEKDLAMTIAGKRVVRKNKTSKQTKKRKQTPKVLRPEIF